MITIGRIAPNFEPRVFEPRVRFLCGLTLLVGFFSTALGMAEVTDSQDNGFVSEHQLILNASPDKAFEALTQGISLWWDASHSYGGEADGFSLFAQAGGCFCERIKNGGSVEHMRVVRAEPGKILVMSGGLGPLQNMAVSGSMTFSFLAQGKKTLLKYRYVVGGYNPGGLKSMAEPVDKVQLGQLQRLQQYLETRQPPN